MPNTPSSPAASRTSAHGGGRQAVKRTEASVTGPDGKQFQVTKGAPQVILALSSDAAKVKSAVDKAVDDFAARGFRALGVARAEGDGEWKFQGVMPLFDPPRDDAKAYNEERAFMAQPSISIPTFVLSAKFWSSSLQTWQAEYLAIALFVVRSPFLRQQGSAESKPIESKNETTGGANK